MSTDSLIQSVVENTDAFVSIISTLPDVGNFPNAFIALILLDSPEHS